MENYKGVVLSKNLVAGWDVTTKAGILLSRGFASRDKARAFATNFEAPIIVAPPKFRDNTTPKGFRKSDRTNARRASRKTRRANR